MMTMKTGEEVIRELLAMADVRPGGGRPWDIQVHEDRLYDRLLAGGSMALGESYMAGWWDCDALDQFFDRILRARLDKRAKRSASALWAVLKAGLINLQQGARVFEIARRHYDIGNDLFRLMLDKRLNYSCGFWQQASTLDEAQEAKLDLICRKLGLGHGMRVLDIGCGWGGFARYAAEKFRVTVTGITVSREQARFAADYCSGLPVEIKLQDYRGPAGTFDRIVSIGMFEHVGCKNYRTYMQVVRRSLASGGLFLLHTIAGNTSTHVTDPWISRYIFPNSMLPSAKQITSAAEGLFTLEDWHSFGPHYDKTLMAWHDNFTRGWESIKSSYDRQFYRMWTYYLLSCAGSFRARRNQLWQIVFSKNGLRGGYNSIRV